MINMFFAGAMAVVALKAAIEGRWDSLVMAILTMVLNLWVVKNK